MRSHKDCPASSDSAAPHGGIAQSACSLCGIELPARPIIAEAMHFCCLGCATVFNILSSKNQLENATEHPLFMQALKTGIISNPALLRHIEEQQGKLQQEEKKRVHLEIAEMWCPSCAEVIRLLLLQKRGVTNCIVDYATDLAMVEYCPRLLSKEKIAETIAPFGYRALDIDRGEERTISLSLYVRFIVAAFSALNAMMLAYPLYATYFSYDGEEYGMLFAWISLYLAIPAVTYSAWPIWQRLFASMRTGLVGAEALVAIGVGAACSLSLYELLEGRPIVYFDSLTVIIAFMLLGKIIETKAKFSAKNALARLIRATPKRARRRNADGTSAFVPVKDIAKGDEILVHVGEKIALDGKVIAGCGTSDESLMTGEAMPQLKEAGSFVLAGSLLVQGELLYEVTHGNEESALAKIINMVEGDLSHKSRYERAADGIVRWFTPCILVLALATAAAYVYLFPEDHKQALTNALAVLLISCPCAIGIAAPTAEAHLLNGLAALGAIVRNRGCLQDLGKESIIIFDKTGTVTEGKFSLHRGLDLLADEDLAALHQLASHSSHPIAQSIAKATGKGQEGRSPPIPEDLQEVIAHGLTASIAKKRYHVGSARFMAMHGIDVPCCTSRKTSSHLISDVYFAKDGSLLANLELIDSIKEGMKELLPKLAPARLILLSGDGKACVDAVAAECGFHEWHANCTPMQKRQFIADLQARGERVCMVGDGINDAPALTAATVGISVVSASDISIQVSDILLTNPSLNSLIDLRRLATKGRLIVKQNLFWAFFYNIVGIVLAVSGLLSPVFAAFAMSISSLTVLFNARRINASQMQ